MMMRIACELTQDFGTYDGLIEDSVFKKKKKNRTTLICFLKKKIFLSCMLKEKIFSEPIIQFVEEGERGQKVIERD